MTRTAPLERFKLLYETDGEGTETHVFLASLGEAIARAKALTLDGSAWPSEARITRETRSDPFAPWIVARDFEPVDVIDGEQQ